MPHAPISLLLPHALPREDLFVLFPSPSPSPPDVWAAYSRDRHLVDVSRRPELLQLLQGFVEPNDSPGSSANYHSPGPDNVQCFFEILMHHGVQQDAEVVLLLLR